MENWVLTAVFLFGACVGTCLGFLLASVFADNRKIDQDNKRFIEALTRAHRNAMHAGSK
jgi:hypothetical protein